MRRFLKILIHNILAYLDCWLKTMILKKIVCKVTKFAACKNWEQAKLLLPVGGIRYGKPSFSANRAFFEFMKYTAWLKIRVNRAGFILRYFILTPISL